ncbi:serine-rich adhesin for platelets-like isoform X2 [Mytilus californianus]|uniref:serine-rich adhesin for platelets-like isoform X2 n=1 Tax=Mytilus californianus TaxID=6549 RepID=UPI0022465267|nr:serine-rich adhesin for platelets-like isoform X2 [Mytilus californianus]
MFTSKIQSIFWTAVLLILIMVFTGTVKGQSDHAFQGRINITSVTWNSNLSIRDSQEFKNLSTKLVQIITCAFDNNATGLLDKTDIENFTEDGGVIATFRLELTTVKNTSEIFDIMKKVTGNCTELGDLTTSSLTIQAVKTIEQPPGTSSPSIGSKTTTLGPSSMVIAPTITAQPDITSSITSPKDVSSTISPSSPHQPISSDHVLVSTQPLLHESSAAVQTAALSSHQIIVTTLNVIETASLGSSNSPEVKRGTRMDYSTIDMSPIAVVSSGHLVAGLYDNITSTEAGYWSQQHSEEINPTTNHIFYTSFALNSDSQFLSVKPESFLKTLDMSEASDAGKGTLMSISSNFVGINTNPTRAISLEVTKTFDSALLLNTETLNSLDITSSTASNNYQLSSISIPPALSVSKSVEMSNIQGESSVTKSAESVTFPQQILTNNSLFIGQPNFDNQSKISQLSRINVQTSTFNSVIPQSSEIIMESSVLSHDFPEAEKAQLLQDMNVENSTQNVNSETLHRSSSVMYASSSRLVSELSESELIYTKSLSFGMQDSSKALQPSLERPSTETKSTLVLPSISSALDLLETSFRTELSQRLVATHTDKATATSSLGGVLSSYTSDDFGTAANLAGTSDQINAGKTTTTPLDEGITRNPQSLSSFAGESFSSGSKYGQSDAVPTISPLISPIMSTKTLSVSESGLAESSIPSIKTYIKETTSSNLLSESQIVSTVPLKREASYSSLSGTSNSQMELSKEVTRPSVTLVKKSNAYATNTDDDIIISDTLLPQSLPTAESEIYSTTLSLSIRPSLLRTVATSVEKIQLTDNTEFVKPSVTESGQFSTSLYENMIAPSDTNLKERKASSIYVAITDSVQPSLQLSDSLLAASATPGMSMTINPGVIRTPEGVRNAEMYSSYLHDESLKSVNKVTEMHELSSLEVNFITNASNKHTATSLSRQHESSTSSPELPLVHSLSSTLSSTGGKQIHPESLLPVDETLVHTPLEFPLSSKFLTQNDIADLVQATKSITLDNSHSSMGAATFAFTSSFYLSSEHLSVVNTDSPTNQGSGTLNINLLRTVSSHSLSPRISSSIKATPLTPSLSTDILTLSDKSILLSSTEKSPSQTAQSQSEETERPVPLDILNSILSKQTHPTPDTISITSVIQPPSTFDMDTESIIFEPVDDFSSISPSASLATSTQTKSSPVSHGQTKSDISFSIVLEDLSSVGQTKQTISSTTSQLRLESTPSSTVLEYLRTTRTEQSIQNLEQAYQLSERSYQHSEQSFQRSTKLTIYSSSVETQTSDTIYPAKMTSSVSLSIPTESMDDSFVDYEYITSSYAETVSLPESSFFTSLSASSVLLLDPDVTSSSEFQPLPMPLLTTPPILSTSTLDVVSSQILSLPLALSDSSSSLSVPEPSTSAPVQPMSSAAPVQPTSSEAPVKPMSSAPTVQPTSSEAPVQPMSSSAPLQPTSSSALVLPMSSAPTVQPMSSSAPVQSTSSSAPVQPMSSAAPVQPTSSSASIQPMSSSAPVQPMSSSAPVQPMSSAAPVQPTSSEALVQPTSSAAPVQPMSSSAPVQPMSSSAPVTPMSSAAPIQPMSSEAEVQSMSSAAPVQPTSSAVAVQSTTSADLVQLTSSAAPVEQTSSAAQVQPTSSVGPVQITSSVVPSEPSSSVVPVQQTSSAHLVQPTSSASVVHPTSSESPDQQTSSVTQIQPTSSAAQVQPTSSIAPVQPMSSEAPGQSTSSAALVQPTSSVATVQPTSSEDPIHPTSSDIHVQPMSSAAPVQPTSSTVPVQATSSVDLVQPTSSAASVRPTSSKAPVQQTSSGAVVQRTSSVDLVKPTSSAIPVQPSSSAAPVQFTSSAAPIQPSASETPVQETSSAAPVHLTSTEPSIQSSTEVHVQPSPSDAHVQTTTSKAHVQPSSTEAHVQPSFTGSHVLSTTEVHVQQSSSQAPVQPKSTDVSVQQTSTEPPVQPSSTETPIHLSTNEAHVQPSTTEAPVQLSSSEAPVQHTSSTVTSTEGLVQPTTSGVVQETSIGFESQTSVVLLLSTGEPVQPSSVSPVSSTASLVHPSSTQSLTSEAQVQPTSASSVPSTDSQMQPSSSGLLMSSMAPTPSSSSAGPAMTTEFPVQPSSAAPVISTEAPTQSSSSVYTMSTPALVQSSSTAPVASTEKAAESSSSLHLMSTQTPIQPSSTPAVKSSEASVQQSSSVPDMSTDIHIQSSSAALVTSTEVPVQQSSSLPVTSSQIIVQPSSATFVTSTEAPVQSSSTPATSTQAHVQSSSVAPVTSTGEMVQPSSTADVTSSQVSVEHSSASPVISTQAPMQSSSSTPVTSTEILVQPSTSLPVASTQAPVQTSSSVSEVSTQVEVQPSSSAFVSSTQATTQSSSSTAMTSSEAPIQPTSSAPVTTSEAVKSSSEKVVASTESQIQSSSSDDVTSTETPMQTSTPILVTSTTAPSTSSVVQIISSSTDVPAVSSSEAVTSSIAPTTTITMTPSEVPTTTKKPSTEAPVTEASTTQSSTTETTSTTTTTSVASTTTPEVSTTSDASTTTQASKTTTQASTTPAVQTTPPLPVITYQIDGSLRITGGESWSDALADKNSPEYNTLDQTLRKMLKEVYGSGEFGNRFYSVGHITFSQGSIIASFKLNYTGSGAINMTTLNDHVTSKVDSGSFGTLIVDKAAVRHSIGIQPTTPTPPTTPAPSTTQSIQASTEKSSEKSELPLPPWGIAVIVCGALVLIFLLTMIAILCTRRQTRMMKYRMSDDMDPDDIGYRRSWGNGETNHAYDNKQETMAVNEEMKHPVPFFDIENSETKELDPQKTTAL